MSELLERINLVAIPLELTCSSRAYGVIAQQALAQLDDDQFAQWVATIWGIEGDMGNLTDSGDLEDWGVATLES